MTSQGVDKAMRQTVLITGGAGFIGSHTAERLLGLGHDVRLLDTLDPQIHPGGRKPSYLPPGAELIVGSVCDPDTVARALDGVTAVFHFAAETGVGQSMHELERYFSTNVTGTAVLWQEIQRNAGKIGTVVLSSSRAVYGEGSYLCESCGTVHPPVRKDASLRQGRWEQHCPVCQRPIRSVPTSETAPTHCTSVYALTKRMQEEISSLVASRLGIRLVILRYFNVYGPRQSLNNPYTGIVAGFATRMLSGKHVSLYEGGVPTRDFVHVSDVVEANVRALTLADEQEVIANVGTGAPTSISDIARELRDALASDAQIVSTGLFRRGDILSCTADIAKARALLKIEAGVRLQEGLRSLVPWLREQNPTDRSDDVENELRVAGVLDG